MEVVGKLILQEFWEAHKKAKRPLQRWTEIVDSATWHCFSDIKQIFGTASLYRSTKTNDNYIIFNVGGNKYRLVTTINYKGQIVVIKVVMIHSKYDLEKWKVNL